ncbi:MAG: chorismate mutase [Spirochaetaceae bacterium]|nr:chorismate mutase [Spirochaetaceae bacterium]
MIKAVRGAISVNENDHKSMIEAVSLLITTMIEKNPIIESNIISIIFSQTNDLNIANPAAALRASGKFTQVPLFCTQEPEYENSIKSVVRVLLTFESDSSIQVCPVYLGEASLLRQDLSSSE